MCRSKAVGAQSRRSSAESEESEEDPWVRFDDLARERVSEIDIHEALRKESPYLLFYQVQPICEDGDLADEHQLPSYTEATSRAQSDATPLEKPYLHEPFGDATLTQASSHPLPPLTRPATDVTDFEPSTGRNSTEAPPSLDLWRGRTGATATDSESRRKSVALDEVSYSGSTENGSIITDPASSSVPSTPSEEKTNGFLNVANKLTGSRRGSNKNPDATVNAKGTAISRPTSTDGKNRLSLNMTKLTQRMSKGQSNTALLSEDAAGPVIVPSEAVARELEGQRSAAVEGVTVAEGVTDRTRMPATQPPQVLPRSKKERKKLKALERGQGGKGEEERECAVM